MGQFGDDALNILHLIFALRAVTNVPGFRPPACSDRFDAMDSFPEDGTARGGDTLLTTLDLIITLRRVTNVDTSRPRRFSRGLTRPAPAAEPLARLAGLAGLACRSSRFGSEEGPMTLRPRKSPAPASGQY